MRRTRSQTQTDMEQVLEKLNTIMDKLNLIEQKVTNVDTRLVTMEQKVDGLTERVNKLEDEAKTIDSLEAKYKHGIRNNEISRIRNEENSRKYNVIIDNVTQDDMFETREDSVKKVRDVLTNVLQINDAGQIGIADAHRLPTSKGRSPLIFKLRSMTDKDLIWKNIMHVKTFNNKQANNNNKVYVNMHHYPAKLQRDKASLLEIFKKYRDRRVKTRWQYNKKSGELCLHVGQRVIRPPTDNFDFKLRARGLFTVRYVQRLVYLTLAYFHSFVFVA